MPEDPKIEVDLETVSKVFAEYAQYLTEDPQALKYDAWLFQPLENFHSDLRMDIIKVRSLHKDPR